MTRAPFQWIESWPALAAVALVFIGILIARVGGFL